MFPLARALFCPNSARLNRSAQCIEPHHRWLTCHCSKRYEIGLLGQVDAHAAVGVLLTWKSARARFVEAKAESASTAPSIQEHQHNLLKDVFAGCELES